MKKTITTFKRPTHEEFKEIFHKAKTYQKQLEEEARRMWQEEQRIKSEAKQYYNLEFS